MFPNKGLLCDAKMERKDMRWFAMVKENIINLTFYTIYQEDLIHALGLTLSTPGLVYSVYT